MKILAKFEPNRQKIVYFCFSVECLYKLEDSRFLNSESAMIRHILYSITYSKISQIREPRLSKVGRGLHAVTHIHIFRYFWNQYRILNKMDRLSY